MGIQDEIDFLDDKLVFATGEDADYYSLIIDRLEFLLMEPKPFMQLPDISVKIGRKPARGKYPFLRMSVGEYFVVPLGKEESCRAAAQRYNRQNNGRRFEIERSDCNPWKIYRVE